MKKVGVSLLAFIFLFSYGSCLLWRRHFAGYGTAERRGAETAEED